MPAIGPQRQAAEQPRQNILSKVRRSLHGAKIQERCQWPARRRANRHQPGRRVLRQQFSPDIFNMERELMRAASESILLRATDQWLQNRRATR